MTIQRLREQSRGCSLANAAGAREDIGMMQTLMLDRIAQRASDWFLTGDLCKSLRPPFSCDYFVGHKSKDEGGRMKDEGRALKVIWEIKEVVRFTTSSFILPPSSFRIGQTPDLPATHAAVATVAPFPAWRGSQGDRCAEPEV